MQSVWRNGRIACGLLIVALTAAGCGMSGQSRYESWQFERTVEEIARSTRHTSQSAPPVTRQVKPAAAQSKTTDSRDYDERHPSRWKRKLKAAYA